MKYDRDCHFVNSTTSSRLQSSRKQSPENRRRGKLALLNSSNDFGVAGFEESSESLEDVAECYSGVAHLALV